MSGCQDVCSSNSIQFSPPVPHFHDMTSHPLRAPVATREKEALLQKSRETFVRSITLFTGDTLTVGQARMPSTKSVFIFILISGFRIYMYLPVFWSRTCLGNA